MPAAFRSCHPIPPKILANANLRRLHKSNVKYVRRIRAMQMQNTRARLHRGQSGKHLEHRNCRYVFALVRELKRICFPYSAPLPATIPFVVFCDGRNDDAAKAAPLVAMCGLPNGLRNLAPSLSMLCLPSSRLANHLQTHDDAFR